MLQALANEGCGHHRRHRQGKGGARGRGPESPVVQLFHAYLPHICEELGLGDPGTLAAEAAAMAVIQETSNKKGVFGSSARWMAGYDCGEHLVKHRHARMFIIDSAVLLQNGSPFTCHVDFADNLSAVFAKEGGQSLRAAAHVLRDEKLFQVLSIKKGVFTRFHVQRMLQVMGCVACLGVGGGIGPPDRCCACAATCSAISAKITDRDCSGMS